jgi:hypothetical protein
MLGSLPRDPRCPVLVRVDDWRAQAPLPVRVVLVADSNLLLEALGLPRMISCMAYEWSLLHLFLWYKSQGIEHVIPQSEKAELKPPHVCPGYSNHTYSNNMINRCNVP